MIGSMFRAAGQAIIFASALGLCCVALGRALPFPEIPQVKEKLEWFRAHRDDYTALFIGTSRVRKHIIPSLFDRLASAQGLPMRSFNLGVDSLAAPEDAYVLDQALMAAPPRLRYVFIELSFFRAAFEEQSADSIRCAYWHDWERTRTIFRKLLQEDFAEIRPLKKRKKQRWSGWSADVSECLGRVVDHGRLFLSRASNLGRGAAWLQVQAGVRPPNNRLAPLGPDLDGFIPLDWVIGPNSADAYQKRLTELRTGPSRARQMQRVEQENLEAMLARVRARGAEPILFVAPSTGGYINYPRREVAPLFDFSDPQKWPELFDPQHRADIGHLNTAGAEIFTRELCEAFLARLPAEHR